MQPKQQQQQHEESSSSLLLSDANQESGNKRGLQFGLDFPTASPSSTTMAPTITPAPAAGGTLTDAPTRSPAPAVAPTIGMSRAPTAATFSPQEVGPAFNNSASFSPQNGVGISPAPSPTGGSGEYIGETPSFGGGGLNAPTAFPTTRSFVAQQQQEHPSPIYAWYLYGIIIVLAVFGVWCLWGHCKRRRERSMQQARSQQADRVLGDMQMVPNEDLDNDLI